MDAASSPGSMPEIPSQTWSWPMTREPEVIPRPAYPELYDGGWIQGAPLGGIGAGGIGRNCRGGFGRWTLKTGAMKHFCDPANMFALRLQPEGGPPAAFALHPGHPNAPAREKARRAALSGWNWDFSAVGCTYHALFPKAWYHYPAAATGGVELLCEQFSPVLSHDYRVSSYPVGVFVWHVQNPLEIPVTVSILFSFTNMVGWFRDFGRGRPSRRNSGNTNRPVVRALAGGGRIEGVVMGRDAAFPAVREGQGQFCIAALADERRSVSRHVAFGPRGSGEAIWAPFVETGALSGAEESPCCRAVQEIAGAICVRFKLAPGEMLTAPVALAWDLPVIAFGSGREHWRRYTRFFGRNGDRAADIAAEALENWPDWSRAIDRWHERTIAKHRRPDWYYSLLFNEAYMLVDGLTVWTDGTRNAPGEDPFFAIIECPDYPFYSTLDLWIYGSFILLENWPELEKNTIRRFARCIPQQSERLRFCPHTGRLFPSEEAGAAPHDFGEPEEDPPVIVNSYVYKNSNRWKDLNCQFVLTLYRDVIRLNDDALLAECWPAVKQALERLVRFDTDGDGLIENDGTPDQTMDAIPMKGVSSYCGGLWLAALHAALDLAERLGDREYTAEWTERARAARAAFDEKLWNGRAYRFDTDGETPDALFIDALFGIWYGRLCGLRDLVPEERYRRSLERVYAENVRGFHGGRFGGVNIVGWGRTAHEGEETTFVTRDCQISEVLCGLNISFAGQLLDAGFEKEAFELLRAIYGVVYERFGLWFRTPAAWTVAGRFRAILNLRPLVVWALEFERPGGGRPAAPETGEFSQTEKTTDHEEHSPPAPARAPVHRLPGRGNPVVPGR